MKKVLALLLAFTFLFSTFALAVDLENAQHAYSPTVAEANPGVIVTTELDDDFMRAVSEAHPMSAVVFNGETGETSLIPFVEPTVSSSLEIHDLDSILPLPSPVPTLSPDPGLIEPNVIIGNDDRRQLYGGSYGAIMFLEITLRNGLRTTASGVLVTRGTVLTAGHNIFCRHNNQWASSILVTPGGTISPFHPQIATNFVTTAGWVNYGTHELDFGLINIPAIFHNVTPYTLRVLTDESLRNAAVWVYGYPRDKPHGTLWYSPGFVTRIFSNENVFHHNGDTTFGNSGGPISLRTNWTNVIGIHVAAVWCPVTVRLINQAVRVTQPLVSFVNLHGRH